MHASQGTLLRTLTFGTAAIGLGSTVAIAGNNVVVGAPSSDTGGIDSGEAHLFNASTGAHVKTIVNPSPAFVDDFGSAVAIFGGTVVIGSPGDDTTIDDVGRAYRFAYSTGTLALTYNSPLLSASDHFGSDVALHGNNVLVGAPDIDIGAKNSGAAYLYGAATGELVRTFTNPSPAVDDNFGAAVAIGGNIAAISAPGDDTGAASAASYICSTLPRALCSAPCRIPRRCSSRASVHRSL